MAPNGATSTVTIVDNDAAPTLSLALSDPVSGQADTIKERANAPAGERMATVTASLSAASGAAVTVTVAASAGTNAAADDFTLSANKTLTIAAGATTSTGTVTITAVNDEIDSIVDDTVAGKKVVVSAGVAGTASQVAAARDSQGNPTAVADLLIWEDDRAALVTNPAFPRCRRAPCPVWLSVDEGASETFTVKLNSQPTTNITVAVKSSDGDEGLVSSGGDTAAASTRLTFTAANWATVQTVTLHGVTDNVVDGDGDYTLRLFPDTPNEATDAYHVIGGASTRPQTVRTTNVDAVGLALSKTAVTVTEGGAGEAFTVALTSQPAGAVTVTATSKDADEVRLAVGSGVPASSRTLTFTRDNWNQPRMLRVEAVDDDVDEPDGETVGVTLESVSPGDGQYNALERTMTVSVNDNDATPTATLMPSANSISENGGVATVTATLTGKSSETVTLTVAAAPGVNAAATDYTLSGTVLTIAAGATTSTGTVTITASNAANDDVHAPDRTVTVSATAAGGNGLADPSAVTLTIEEDETKPTLTLVLTPATIDESGTATTVATVTATLTGKSSEAVTVTVTAAPGANAAATDYTLSGTTLTIAAGATTSTGTVTIAAMNDVIVGVSKSVTVSGTAAGGNNVEDPSALTLMIRDDDAPTVTLVLTPAAINEGGTATTVSTVTATLSAAATGPTMIAVSAAPGANAAATDYTLSGTMLTVATGATTSTGTVTLTAVDNAVDAPDKQVTVSGTTTGGDGAGDPFDATLTISDDDAAPGVTLSVSPDSISENGGTSTVSATLSHPSSAATTVTVTPVAGFYTVGTGAAGIIVIPAGQTANAADTATVTAVDDAVHQGSVGRTTTVTATVANPVGTGNVTGATLTLTDNETPPNAALALSDTSIPEMGGDVNGERDAVRGLGRSDDGDGDRGAPGSTRWGRTRSSRLPRAPRRPPQTRSRLPRWTT